MELTAYIFLGAVALFTATAAVLDITTRRLPNWLTVSGLVAGLVFQFATAGWQGLASALLGFLVGFSILLVMWLIGGGGGGDVKLMGALGAWLGPQQTITVFVASALLVVLGSVAVLVFQLLTRGAMYIRRRYATRPDLDGRRIKPHDRERMLAEWRVRRRVLPYAVPVALATWITLGWSFVTQAG